MTQDADASKAGVKTVDGAEKKAGASGPKKPRKQPAAQGGKPARQSKLTAVPNPGRVAARRRRKRRRQSVLKKPVPQPQVTVRPLAQPAAMKQRHWGLMLSFVLIVLLPLVGLTYYLWTQAEDQ